MTIRDGSPDDLPAVLGFMDEAVAWMVERGQTGQWGSEPISGRPSFVGRLEEWERAGGLRIAETEDGEPAGALIVGAAHDYVRAVSERELYVILLVTSRRHAGRDIGGALVQRAIDEARAAEARLLRVDCWAGAPRLVQWYEEQGFVPVERFRVGDWEGQLFELRIDA